MHFIKKLLNKNDHVEKSTPSRYKLLTRIISFLLLLCMLPAYIPDSFAAGSGLAYRYIWLISKPTFKYNYTDDSGVWIVNPDGDNFKLTLSGEYWVASQPIRVESQYTNETIPDWEGWEGTSFEYTGTGKSFSSSLVSSESYTWAGNVSGGSHCSTTDDPSDFLDGMDAEEAEEYAPSRVIAPPRFNSGGTDYQIYPRLKDSLIKSNMGEGRQTTTNFSCFLFKSTKPLPSWGSDPVVSEVHADLKISANDVYMNYKKFDVDGYVSTQVTFDPTGSTSALDWDSYGMDGSSMKASWNMSDSWDGPPERQQFEVEYSKSDLGFRGSPGKTKDYISGEVVVSDGETSDRATDEATVDIEFFNDAPIASIGSIKSTNLTSIGSSYDSTFYYVGEPIQITDASYDPENRQYDSYTDDPVVNYWVEHNGNNILVVNGMNASGVDYLDSYVESATVNGSAITATFKKAGYYTIGVQIQDEVGSWNETTKTIKVSGDPQPPTAVINSGNYTFVDYPLNVSDSSTDPNNDIVTWTWGKITSIDEEGNEVAANGVSGSLKGGTLPAGSTNKPSGIGGTLTFGAPGEYDIHLTVTDATKLSDEAVKTVKVIRDIPVAEIEPGPESSDNPSDSDPHYALDPEDELEKVYVKQNRKVELDASNSLSPPASPIQWEKTEWIYDVSDTDPEFDLTTVNVDSSSTVKKQVFLAKEVGEFKITLTLHNEYSDALPDTDPDLAARTKTIIVKVLPDEPPVSTIQVDNMNPNFHDNPASVNVKVVATGKSLDNDFIDYYNWSLYRDNNNDGVYDPSTEELTNRKGTNSTEITIPVKFESGNTSTFLGKVEAYERFGQETIDKFITADDIRMSSSEMEFEVNWRPCISYTMREFAYVDDTLTIIPVLKDENVETCTVEWTLMKKNSAGEYEAIDPASVEANVFGDKPIWELGLHGGTIRITKDGYYRLDAVITDAEGHSEQFSSTEIRIYDVPHAVISDGAEYRWNGQAFQFKESRKFTLNGNLSYVDDSTGSAKHQIDRSLDEWTITPLDGQDASQIYVGMTADGTAKMSSTETTRFNPGRNSFDEVLAILEPGRYRVDYQVTNTYGKKSPITTQNIVIVEDIPPVIDGTVTSRIERGDATEEASVPLTITGLTFQSNDSDFIDKYTIKVAYDSDNDGSFADETWAELKESQDYTVIESWDGHVKVDVKVMKQDVGNYQFYVWTKEAFGRGQDTLPIVPDSERKTAEQTFDIEIDNSRPTGEFTTKNSAMGDVLFALGNSEMTDEIKDASEAFVNRFNDEKYMDVKVNAVETVDSAITSTDLDFDSILNSWDKVGADVWTAENGLLFCKITQVDWTGEYGGWSETAIFNPLAYDTDNITAELTVNNGGDLMEGFAWRVTHDKETDTYSGYFLNLGAHAWNTEWNALCGGRNGSSLMKFENIYFDGSFSQGPLGMINCERTGLGRKDGEIAQCQTTRNGKTFTSKITFLDSHSSIIQGNVRIQMIDNEIKVFQNDQEILSAIDNSFEKGTYGFWGNNCEQPGTMKISNIQIQAKTIQQQSLADAISDVSWRPGAERFVVYTEDDIAGFGSKNTISSVSSDAKKILDSWIGFPANHLWEYDESEKVLHNADNPPYETGFINPNAFDTKEFTFRSEVFVNEGNQPVGLLFGVHPNSQYPNRYDWYEWGTAGKYMILYKVTGYDPYKGVEATGLQTYIGGEGDLPPNHDPSVDHLGWTGDFRGFTENYGGFPNWTPIKVGVKVRNEIDPICETEILGFTEITQKSSGTSQVLSGTYQNPIVIGSAGICAVNRGWHTISADIHGNTITCTFDDDTLVLHEDNPMQGSMGFYQLSHVDPAFKNFTISTGEKFIDSAEYARLQAILQSENVHLIVLGTEVNEEIACQLLNQLDKEGIFLKNDPSSLALDNSESFIKRILRSLSKDTIYLLLNETVSYEKSYYDANGDPQWLWDNVTISDADWARLYWGYRDAQGKFVPYDYPDTVPQQYQADFEKFKALMERFWEDPSVLASRWKYYHDPDWYDNSLGKASFASSAQKENWLASEITSFDKTGRYLIDYQIKDNPVPDKTDNTPDNTFDSYRYWSQNYANNEYDDKGQIANPYVELFVHRKPLAEFSYTLDKVNEVVRGVNITNKAYDLDHENGTNTDKEKGLNLFEWKWKFASDDGWRGEGLFTDAATAQEWINSQLKNLNTMDMSNILIQYRVRDVDGDAKQETITETVKNGNGWTTQNRTYTMNQGVWSDYNTVWISNTPKAPVAHFRTDNSVYDLGESINVTDSSYSPNGDQIAKWDFTVTRNDGKTEAKQFTYNLSQMTGATYEEKVRNVEQRFSSDLSSYVDQQPVGYTDKENEYKITLVVTDAKAIPMISDPYSVTIRMQPTNNAPEVGFPDEDKPSTPEGDDGDGKSIWGKNNPTVYEYDVYDANKINPYYTYGGQAQMRGQEYLDWTLVLDDPDNHDKYGPGNDTEKYQVQYVLDRSPVEQRSSFHGVTQSTTYPARILTETQALDNNSIAPFLSAQKGALGYGAYRITVNVTDIPNNGSEGKTTSVTTYGDKKPLHLYVIPKLDVAAPHFSYDGVQDNQTQIPTGEVVTITTTTNDRSTGAKILYKDGDGSALEQEMVLVKTEGETKYWSADFVIPDNLEAEDLISGEYYPYQVETYTNYGSQAGEVTRAKTVDGAANIHILPIKLYDFTITGITDPSVVFGGDTTVRDLAYDRANSENGALMKLGYAFNFKVYSKGMKDSDDYVRIRPTFWGYNNATGRYDMPLDVYYLNDNDEYVLATTNPDNSAASGDDFTIKTQEFFGKTIGSIRELKLTSNFRDAADRNTQVWSARYGLPGTAVFVGKGGSLTETNMYLGDVLINFDIEAMKHGSAKYNYIGKSQWRIERTDGNGNFLNPDKTKYEDGDVILMDGMNNATLDFESRPVWTKLQ